MECEWNEEKVDGLGVIDGADWSGKPSNCALERRMVDMRSSVDEEK